MQPRAAGLAGAIALVTGATGFAGSVLVRRLHDTGVRVRAIARAESDISPLADLPVEWIRGDVFDEPVVREAARDVQYVWHLAAAYREARHSDDYFRRVHVESTQHLARAVRGQPAFKRFVHVSTVGVHGHISTPPADETYPLAPGDVYQATKAEAELWLREFAARERLPITVIRPAAIFGPGDRRLLKLFQMARWRVFPMVGYQRGLYHLVHVDDLVEAVVLAATHPDACDQVFICGNDEPIGIPDIARVVARAYGQEVRVVRVPAWPLFAAADVITAICRPMGLEPPLHRRRVAFYTKDRSFDTRKIRETLGWRPRFSNQTGIEQTARWYREHGWA